MTVLVLPAVLLFEVAWAVRLQERTSRQLAGQQQLWDVVVGHPDGTVGVQVQKDRQAGEPAEKILFVNPRCAAVARTCGHDSVQIIPFESAQQSP
ncbi:hypothetical protein ES703_86623 [subsurface metagenome]